METSGCEVALGSRYLLWAHSLRGTRREVKRWRRGYIEKRRERSLGKEMRGKNRGSEKGGANSEKEESGESAVEGRAMADGGPDRGLIHRKYRKLIWVPNRKHDE